jgi:hypothetical protein
MSWETISGIIISVVSSGAIIAFVAKFAAELLANRISEKYKHDFELKIEQLKADLENRNHSYQTKFNKEFQLYGKLTASFFCLKNSIFWLFPTAFDYPPSDEEEKLKFYTKRYNKAYTDLIAASTALGENSIFIPENIYLMFEEILKLCSIQYDLYPTCGQHLKNKSPSENQILRECKERSSDIQKQFNTLTQKLREYINQKLE